MNSLILGKTALSNKEYLKYTPYSLINHDNSPSLDYVKIENSTVVPDENQRLLMAEINFLNLYFIPSDKKAIVVYIGSSPGNHIPKLTVLYPELEYHLYDSAEPSEQLSAFELKSSNIIIFRHDFTEDDIEQYKNPDLDVYLFTDFLNHKMNALLKETQQVKYLPKSSETKIKLDLLTAQKEALFDEDMIWQMSIVEKMQPKVSFLKFRLPHFYEGITQDNTVGYLDGTAYRMIFSEAKTIECRLVVSSPTQRSDWNFKLFEKQMLYYNQITRENPVINPVSEDNMGIVGGYGNGFDKMVRLWIYKEYLLTRGHMHPRIPELIRMYEENPY